MRRYIPAIAVDILVLVALVMLAPVAGPMLAQVVRAIPAQEAGQAMSNDLYTQIDGIFAPPAVWAILSGAIGVQLSAANLRWSDTTEENS